MAVMRLKSLRNAARELTEEEENKLPGCPWAVNHQMSNYCFFKFASDYLEAPLSETEIAHLNNISKETIKKAEKDALDKIRDLDDIKEAVELHGGEAIVSDRAPDDDPYSII